MDVKFLKGTWAQYQASTKTDETTFAYITTGEHAGELYFGKYNDGHKLLSNEVTLAAFNALEARVKALEDASFQDQIDAINETLKSIATSDTVTALAQRVSDIEAQEATWNGKQNALDAGQLAAVNSGINADKVADYDETKQTVDNFFASDAAIEGAIDTLKEIANYIATDKEGAADITARVGALEGKVDVEKVTTAISDAIEAQDLKALAKKDTIATADIDDKAVTKAKLEDSVQASLALADTALQSHQDISHLATKQEVKAVNDGLDNLQVQHDTFENEVYTSAVFTSGITANLVAQITTNKETIAQNAQTCQSNFNTISEQLTWGSF